MRVGDQLWGAFERVPGWVIATVGGGAALGGFASGGDPATATTLSFASVVHGLGVVLGTLAVLWPVIRHLVRDSDRKTAAVVNTVSSSVATAMAREMDIIRKEQGSYGRTLQSFTAQLSGVHTAIRETSDISEKLGVMLATQQKQTKDMNEFFARQRVFEERLTAIEQLVKTP